MKILKTFVLVTICLFCSLSASAYNFKVGGIYYTIISNTDLTVAVTYENVQYGSYYSNYSGNITIPGTITYNGKIYSVTSIGESAFRGCSGLTSVTIGNSVTTIGNGAFYGCKKLTSVTIPNSVTSIGNSVFSVCSGLTSIIVESGNPNYDSRENCNAIIETSTNKLIIGCKETIIPNSVTSIGEDAFFNCYGLTSVTIPNGVTSIGQTAFAFCEGLTSVTIGNSVTSIEKGAFAYCDGLTSVTIPNSVTSIGESAFRGCSCLTSVTIPNGVTSIGGDAFTNCYGLTSVTIGNSVTTIGEYAFFSCYGLTSVTIPNSVTSIGKNAFLECSCLTSVTIGNGVTSIGDNAFSRCDGLTSVTVYHETPLSINSNVFKYCPKNTLYVPAGTKELYQSAEGWKDFKNIIEIDIATSNENISVPTVFNVQRTDGGVTIHSDKLIDLSIYNINGQLVKKSRIHGSEHISLPKGFYILSAENQNQKLIIK